MLQFVKQGLESLLRIEIICLMRQLRQANSPTVGELLELLLAIATNKRSKLTCHWKVCEFQYCVETKLLCSVVVYIRGGDRRELAVLSSGVQIEITLEELFIL